MNATEKCAVCGEEAGYGTRCINHPKDEIDQDATEAQVEAAAIVMFQQSAGMLLRWDTRPDYLQESFREDARAVLRAARVSVDGVSGARWNRGA